MKLFAPERTGEDPVKPVLDYANTLRTQSEFIAKMKHQAMKTATLSGLGVLAAGQALVEGAVAGYQRGDMEAQVLHRFFAQNPGIAHGVFAAGIAAGAVFATSAIQARKLAKVEATVTAAPRPPLPSPSPS